MIEQKDRSSGKAGKLYPQDSFVSLVSTTLGNLGATSIYWFPDK